MSLLQTSRTSLKLQILSMAHCVRLFHVNPTALAKALPPRLKFEDEELREAFLHGSGPGGQKINKTACAVQLTHLPTGLVTRCQETRSRSQNRKIARRVLGEKVEALEKGSESRTAIKAEAKSKKKASASKKARRKYRAAEEAKEEEEDEGDGNEDKNKEAEDKSQEGEAMIVERVG